MSSTVCDETFACIQINKLYKFSEHFVAKSYPNALLWELICNELTITFKNNVQIGIKYKDFRKIEIKFVTLKGRKKTGTLKFLESDGYVMFYIARISEFLNNIK